MKITITKNHLEDMKKKLNERMYRIQETFRAEQEYNMACWEESEYLNSISENDIVCELDQTYRLCDDIDWYIEYLKDDGIEVNSNDWFNEWYFFGIVNDKFFDICYMFPMMERTKILYEALLKCKELQMSLFLSQNTSVDISDDLKPF